MKHVFPRLESPHSPGWTLSLGPISPVHEPKLYLVEIGPDTAPDDPDAPVAVSLCSLFTAPAEGPPPPPPPPLTIVWVRPMVMPLALLLPAPTPLLSALFEMVERLDVLPKRKRH